MASENETVAEIVNKVHSGDYGCSKCGDLCDCPNADKIIVSIADRIESAHRREVAELQDDVLRLKDIIAAERAQHASGEARRNAEVAELRECLEEVIGCADEFQKFFEMHPYLCKYTRDLVKKSRKALEGAKDGK